MRPRRLELEGFATFRSPTVLDFGDLDLVAFVGPTGAGKSTIIDAITFALYGSVARYDNANAVAPVIHQLSNEAKVRFDFELAGRQYAVVRVVRRRGTRTRTRDATTGASPDDRTGPGDRASAGATTKEARLERFPDGGRDGPADGAAESEVLAGSVGELDAAIRDLIGLDFSQFTRTVVLPQGEFARFLNDEPATRQKLLRSLLDLDIYARMGSAAREAAKVAANQADALAGELERQDVVDDAALDESAATVEALAALTASVEADLEALAAVDADLGPVRDRVVAVDGERELLSGVTVPGELERSETAMLDAELALSAAADAVSAARSVRDEIHEAMAAIGDRSRLDASLARFERCDEARAELDRANDRLAELQAELASANDQVTTATAESDRARAAVSTARQSADAAVWVAHLVEGEPCPVCRQPVATVPDHPDDDLAAVEEAARSAEAEVAELTRLQSKLAGTVQATEHRIDELNAAISEHQGALEGERREQLESQREQLAELDERSQTSMAELKQAEDQLDALTANRRRLTEVVDRWSIEFAGQRDAVSRLGPPGPTRESLLADWTALAEWAVGRHQALTEERAELAATGKELARRKADIGQGLADKVAPHGIDPDPDNLVAALAVARSEAAGRLEAARNRRAEQERLRSRIAELAADREINNAMGRHLSASGFEGWLLNEALDNIVARATGWLHDLSGGGYSLAVANRDFAVIDHNNADERRDVRTLSGGETFLTSLSLALALADSIAELAPVDAPRLESMFLDEGFGTLDPSTLDVVAAAIEDLASTGRMIGIVTHVRDLAERMPARFEVTKTPAGSTVELVEI